MVDGVLEVASENKNKLWNLMATSLSFCRFKPSKGDVKEPTMFGAGLRSNLQNIEWVWRLGPNR